MRLDEKKYFDIPRGLLAKMEERGYRKVSVSDEPLFDSYFDRMNGHWSSSTCFCNMYSWGDSFPTFFKEAAGMIVAVNYVREDGYLAGIPFIGEYTVPRVRDAMTVMRDDFRYFGEKLSILDVSPWMAPFYLKSGVYFHVEDNRDYMDYIFTPEQFLSGMNAQDDRYRYRYFLRKHRVEIAENSLYDAAYLASMIEADFWGSSIEDEEHMARYIKDVLGDVDGYDGLVLCRFLADCSAKGNVVFWERML